jgi:hypothetical protein
VAQGPRLARGSPGPARVVTVVVVLAAVLADPAGPVLASGPPAGAAGPATIAATAPGVAPARPGAAGALPGSGASAVGTAAGQGEVPRAGGGGPASGEGQGGRPGRRVHRAGAVRAEPGRGQGDGLHHQGDDRPPDPGAARRAEGGDNRPGAAPGRRGVAAAAQGRAPDRAPAPPRPAGQERQRRRGGAGRGGRRQRGGLRPPDEPQGRRPPARRHPLRDPLRPGPPGHQTSARDLGRLWEVAMRRADFRSLVATRAARIPVALYRFVDLSPRTSCSGPTGGRSGARPASPTGPGGAWSPRPAAAAAAWSRSRSARPTPSPTCGPCSSYGFSKFVRVRLAQRGQPVSMAPGRPAELQAAADVDALVRLDQLTRSAWPPWPQGGGPERASRLVPGGGRRLVRLPLARAAGAGPAPRRRPPPAFRAAASAGRCPGAAPSTAPAASNGRPLRGATAPGREGRRGRPWSRARCAGLGRCRRGRWRR